MHCIPPKTQLETIPICLLNPDYRQGHHEEAKRGRPSGPPEHLLPLLPLLLAPLIYKAVPSWFIRVEAIVPLLLENNQKCYWVPEFVKEKRWLRDARDWAVSRKGTGALPCPCGSLTTSAR